ncbi:hypothetical protein [Frateuria terrea]|uniref:Uncharacterized protein n=1 Tax=Frateuria terrea TaxID=529704 RepID=A0A1H6VYZ0_9GAMM|nr:hypothetical protein [Frateuria terrea]SEJ05422.1 hypothetical protein SAMN04487997_2343 [Frateuria terrea]
MNQTEVRLRLMKLREIFDLSVGAYALLTEEPARSELSKYTVRYNDLGAFQATKSDPTPEGWRLTYQIQFRDADYRQAAQALVERSKRQAIIESFALIREYSKDTPAWAEMSQEAWFYFTMFYRNAVAHNGRWQFSAKDRAKLPITFMNIRIEESMDGESIDGFLNLWKARQLLAKMERFVIGDRNLT